MRKTTGCGSTYPMLENEMQGDEWGKDCWEMDAHPRGGRVLNVHTCARFYALRTHPCADAVKVVTSDHNIF